MNFKVIIIGDLAVDIKGFYGGLIKPSLNILLKNLSIEPGGVAGNIAYYLRLFKDDVFVFASVGNDSWGKLILNNLTSLKIDIENIKIVDRFPTGFFVIIIDKKGERTMIGSRGANEMLDINEEELKRLSPDWIHVSGYSLLNHNKIEILEKVQRTAKALGINYSVDLEGVGEKDIKLNLNSAIVFCNPENCREKSRVGAKLTLIKKGSKGCTLLDSGKKIDFKAIKVKVVDTTGAGDAFDASFIHAYLTSKDPELSCQFANYFAGMKVTKKGTRVKLPYNIILKKFGLS